MSIQNQEAIFAQDLDGDGVVFDPDNIDWNTLLNSQATDTKGWKLKKDDRKSLYIVNENETPSDGTDDTVLTIKDEWGGNVHFDHSHSWGAGKNESSALAAEINSDGTFSIAIKHGHTD